MSIIIRLQNLPWSANSLDIRRFFSGLSIPEGGVHIVGGEMGDAFIAFSTDEDARLAMAKDGGKIKDMQIKLLLSSRTEMMRVIEQARQQNMVVTQPHIVVPQPPILSLQQPPRVIPSAPEPDRRRGRSPSPHHRSRDRSPVRDRRRSPDDRRGSKRDRSRSPSRSSRGFSREVDRRNDRFKRDDKRYDDSRYRDDRRSARDPPEESKRYTDADHVNSKSQLHSTDGFRDTQPVYDQVQNISAAPIYHQYGSQQLHPAMKGFADTYSHSSSDSPAQLSQTERMIPQNPVDVAPIIDQKHSTSAGLYPHEAPFRSLPFESSITTTKESSALDSAQQQMEKLHRRSRFEPEFEPHTNVPHFNAPISDSQVPPVANPVVSSSAYNIERTREDYSETRTVWPPGMIDRPETGSWAEKRQPLLNPPVSKNVDFLQVVPMDLDPSPSETPDNETYESASPRDSFPYAQNPISRHDDFRRDNQNRGLSLRSDDLRRDNQNRGSLSRTDDFGRDQIRGLPPQTDNFRDNLVRGPQQQNDNFRDNQVRGPPPRNEDFRDNQIRGPSVRNDDFRDSQTRGPPFRNDDLRDNSIRGLPSRNDDPRSAQIRGPPSRNDDMRDYQVRGLLPKNDDPRSTQIRGPPRNDDLRDNQMRGFLSRNEDPRSSQIRGPLLRNDDFRDNQIKGLLPRNEDLRGNQMRGPPPRNDELRDNQIRRPPSRNDDLRSNQTRGPTPRNDDFRDNQMRGPLSRNDDLRENQIRGPPSINDDLRRDIPSRGPPPVNDDLRRDIPNRGPLPINDDLRRDILNRGPPSVNDDLRRDVPNRGPPSINNDLRRDIPSRGPPLINDDLRGDNSSRGPPPINEDLRRDVPNRGHPPINDDLRRDAPNRGPILRNDDLRRDMSNRGSAHTNDDLRRDISSRGPPTADADLRVIPNRGPQSRNDVDKDIPSRGPQPRADGPRDNQNIGPVRNDDFRGTQNRGPLPKSDDFRDNQIKGVPSKNEDSKDDQSRGDTLKDDDFRRDSQNRRPPPINEELKEDNLNKAPQTDKDNQGRIPSSLTIEVKGLPPDARMDDILSLFQGISLPAANIRIEASDRGFEKAFIRFSSAAEFEEAFNRNRRFMQEGRCELIPCPDAAFDNAPRPQKSKPKPKPREEDFTVEMRGLPFTCKGEDLVKFFDGLTILDLHIEMNPNGKATGVGFVEFGSPKDFRAALAMNGKMINHRYITISVASKEMMALARREDSIPKDPRPNDVPTPKPPVNQNRSIGSPNKPLINQGRQPPSCIFMTGLPEGVTNRDIADFLGQVNVMPRAIHIMLRPDKMPSGDAYAEFPSPADMETALETSGKVMAGNRILVEPISYYEMSDILGRPTPNPPPSGPSALLRTPGEIDRPRRPLLPQGPGNPPYRERSPVVRGGRPYLDPHRNSMEGPPGRPPFGTSRVRGPWPSRPFKQEGRFPPPALDRGPKDFGSPGCVVAMNNLHFRAGLEDILEFFHGYHITKDNVIRKYNENGQTTGEARVAFQNPRDAQRVVRELNQKPIMGRPLSLYVV